MNFYNRLILHPKNIEYCPQQRELHQFLLELGLINHPWHFQGEDYYLVGEQFLTLMMFMGCSPSIELQPNDNDVLPANLVAVRISEVLPQAIFFPPSDAYFYRCPGCKQGIGPLQRQEIAIDSRFECPHCQKTFLYHSCRWRHQAGVGRIFIEIMGIFPQEVLPSKGLLAQLQAFSGVSWDYFYVSNL